MKKLLYQKFITDTLKIFTLISLSIALIVWVIQAVNFLDFVPEDGHGFRVYFSYSLLKFPKILHRVLPFAFFVSLFYQIYKYEERNELLIFWTNGVKKINFINILLLYSILIVGFQIVLSAFVSPMGQNKARKHYFFQKKILH